MNKLNCTTRGCREPSVVQFSQLVHAARYGTNCRRSQITATMKKLPLGGSGYSGYPPGTVPGIRIQCRITRRVALRLEGVLRERACEPVVHGACSARAGTTRCRTSRRRRGATTRPTTHSTTRLSAQRHPQRPSPPLPLECGPGLVWFCPHHSHSITQRSAGRRARRGMA